MIIVTYYKEKKIKISGHANFDFKGKDIVCAAISAVVIGCINVLESFNKNEINYDNNGTIVININHVVPLNDRIRLDMMKKEIKMIADKYPKNIKIIIKK